MKIINRKTKGEEMDNNIMNKDTLEVIKEIGSKSGLIIIKVLIVLAIIGVIYIIYKLYKKIRPPKPEKPTEIIKEKIKRKILNYFKNYYKSCFSIRISNFYAYSYDIQPSDREKILSGIERVDFKRIGSFYKLGIEHDDYSSAHDIIKNIISKEFNVQNIYLEIADCIKLMNDYYENKADIDALNEVKDYVPEKNKKEWQKDYEKKKTIEKEIIEKLHN